MVFKNWPQKNPPSSKTLPGNDSPVINGETLCGMDLGKGQRWATIFLLHFIHPKIKLLYFALSTTNPK